MDMMMLFSCYKPPVLNLIGTTVLRDQLLSQVNTSNNPRDQNEMHTSSPASPNDPLDHTMSGSGMMSTSAGSDDGNDNDGRKGYGKRELSTSKRAAQNRAAQVSQQIGIRTKHLAQSDFLSRSSKISRCNALELFLLSDEQPCTARITRSLSEFP
jgi:hypothetical protein